MLVRIQCPTPNLGRVIHVAVDPVLKTGGREIPMGIDTSLFRQIMRVWWNAYTLVLEASARKGLGVQVPPRAPSFPLVAQSAGGDVLKKRTVLVRI